jgi:predicted lipoprotein with Yx(FWY)xxD motif
VVADPASYDLATTDELNTAVATARIDGQQDVLSAPASYELYDESSIIELNVATPMLSMTNDDNQAEVEFAIETSDDLQTWSVEERIQRTLEGQGEKYFVRVTAGTPYVEPDVFVYTHPTLGDILTNADGEVLYAYTSDSAGQDPLYTGSAWPLVDSSDAPVPDAGVTASLAGASFDNVSGGPWLTVNGLPVYTYVSDSAPYEASGHGAGYVWFTIRADGSVNQP